MPDAKIRKIDPRNIPRELIREAAERIAAGGIVVYPTSGLYGLGADAFDPAAVGKLFHIKERPADKPVSILINSRDILDSLTKGVSPIAEEAMGRFWPGGLTAILTARPDLNGRLTAGTGKIGVRIPAHPVASCLVTLLASPLTATSANISGRPGCFSIGRLDSRVRERADLILDAGTLKGGPGSTVVDFTSDPPAILREGAVPTSDVIGLFHPA